VVVKEVLLDLGLRWEMSSRGRRLRQSDLGEGLV
jgi:hypothetical protein